MVERKGDRESEAGIMKERKQQWGQVLERRRGKKGPNKKVETKASN